MVGPRDAENKAVSVRARGVEKDLGAMPLAKFVADIEAEIASKSAVLGVKPSGPCVDDELSVECRSGGPGVGTNFFSLHLKSTDVDQVRVAMDAAAEQVGGAAFVAPSRSGWVVVYPSMELLSPELLGAIAVDAHASDAVVMSLFDSDVLCYWYFRNGELADYFNSCPDYFGEASDEDMTAKGDAKAFAPILDAAGVRKLTKLIKGRMINGEAVGGEIPDFEDERFTQIADAIGLQHAAGFYEYLAEGEAIDGLGDAASLVHLDHRD